MSNKSKELLDFKESSMPALSVGFGNFVMCHRVVAILESGSLPMKRLRERAVKDNLLIDATAGRKTRSLIVTSSQHLVLSALSPQALQERMNGGRVALSREEVELEHGQFAS